MFYIDSENRKQILTDSLDVDDIYTGVRYESVTLENCSEFSAYAEMVFLMTVIEKLSFERFSDEVTKLDEQGEIIFSHNIKEISSVKVQVYLGVSLVSESKYDIKAQISGIFSIAEDSVLGRKVLSNNTVAILFPYLRSQLTLLTSQPGFEPVILPVMNINALLGVEDNENRGKTQG